MRSLPWLNANTDDAGSENELKRKRDQKKAAPAPPQVSEVEIAEVVENSDSGETTSVALGRSDADSPHDAMIPGYDHDDAYIMVEHDLLEAARLVTRELHLEAYLKHATAPVQETILRPTIGSSQNKRKGVEMSDIESDVGDTRPRSLRELLTQRPAERGVAATPIKRRRVSPESPESPLRRSMGRAMAEVQPKRAPVTTVVKPIPTSRTFAKEPIPLTVALPKAQIVGDDDEDDEDLDKPIQKKAHHGYSLADIQIHHNKPAPKRDTAQLPPSPPQPTKRQTPSSDEPSLDPDWLFAPLWEETARPPRPPMKRDKVSLASQLGETTFNITGKKKPISLKEQFKFLES